MALWTAFLLGLVGSLHCAGMCGPLALALPGVGRDRFSFLLGRAAYQAGRLFTYATIGVCFGLAGHALSLAGFQRWLSLTAGAVVLLGLVAASRLGVGTRFARGVSWIKRPFARLLLQRTHLSLLLLGALNGLLPCGLVYAAAAGAAAAGDWLDGVAFMIWFGLGTLPMMAGLSLAGARLQPLLRLRLHRLIPACALCVGILLVLRGLALGIPYVSPRLADAGATAAACH